MAVTTIFGAARLGRRGCERVLVRLVVLDVHLATVFLDPVITLMLIVGEGSRGSMLAQTGCSCKSCWSSAHNEDIMDVHCA